MSPTSRSRSGLSAYRHVSILHAESFAEDGRDDGGEPRGGLVGGDAGWHSHEHVDVIPAPPFRRIQRHAHPHFVVALAGHLESARHHADDRAGLLVEREDAADGVARLSNRRSHTLSPMRA